MKLVRILFLIFIIGYYSKILFQVLNNQATYDNLKAFTIGAIISFFAATFGVACYSQVEMIGSICTLLARGAIISMIVVLLVLPAMFMIFDKLICKTSIGFLGKKAKAQTSEAK